jgi:NAD(P)-dependent dehydrogenase (short-subunit alcohol dehydrogenase family)
MPDGLPPRALVTGGALRVGHTLVLALVELGFAVAVHCHRSVTEAEALVAEIAAANGRAVVVEADLADAAATAGLVDAAAAALGGPIGVLVNNAAMFEPDRLATFELERFRRQLAVNLEAPLLLTRAFVRALPENTSGLVVNLGDQRTANPTAHYLGYSISKAGLAMASAVIARDLATRVRVNTIALGLAVAQRTMDEAHYEDLVRATPLGRATNDGEIARALALIIRSPSMTGSTITLDSGMAMGWLYPER